MSRIGRPPVSSQKRRYSPRSRSTLFDVRASSMSGPEPGSGCRDSAAAPSRPALRLDRFQRSDALPGHRFERLAQRRLVVGHQLSAVARPADFHIEGLQVGEVRMVRLHRGDHGIHRPALKRMHVRVHPTGAKSFIVNPRRTPARSAPRR